MDLAVALFERVIDPVAGHIAFGGGAGRQDQDGKQRQGPGQETRKAAVTERVHCVRHWISHYQYACVQQSGQVIPPTEKA